MKHSIFIITFHKIKSHSTEERDGKFKKIKELKLKIINFNLNSRKLEIKISFPCNELKKV